ncbi:MAG: glycosyltransferase family 4 protein [Longimicrobiales bacterium]
MLSNASSKWGGVHRVTELLAEGFEKRGHEVLVLCRPGSLLEDRLRGRCVYAPVARGMDFSPWAIARIAMTLRRFRPTIVLGLMDKDLRLTGPAARLLGMPFIARRANDQPIGSGPWARMIYGRIVTHHIANSEATKRTMLASASWLDPERVSVIPNGVDVEGIASTPPAFLPLPKGSVIVALVARLEQRKGVLDLLEAWPSVAQADARAQLVIVGRGELENDVHRRSQQLERVIFLGYREDVAAVLQRCDIVAVPSHWEGFGLVAAEAMAAAKPVVATNASSLPEIVTDEREGLLVPPRQPNELADALLRLIRDAELRKRLGEAGRQRALESFSHERMIERYESILTKFARRGKAESAAR